MNRFFKFTFSLGLMGLIPGFLAVIPVQAASPATAAMVSAPGDAAPNTVLAAGMAAWKKITHRISYLESENIAWESRFNPEREDRNWWNPLWRSSAERHLQRSNENSLQIRELEKQRSELEPTLLELADHYIHAIPVRIAEFPAVERDFWSTVDAWRMPIWLQRLAELKTDRGHLIALNPELQVRRRQVLEQHYQTAKSLDLYISWRKSRLLESEQKLLPQLQTWQTQIQAWLGEMQPWLTDTKPARTDAP
jgi:hypothetical protein